MQRDQSIDDNIVELLKNFDKLSYLKLKKLAEELLGRNLSFDTYTGHLKYLISKKILKKEDTGRRREPVYYSLTPLAKRKLQLNLLGATPKQTLFKKIYEKIFFYEIFNRPLNILRTEEELIDLIKELGINLKNLHRFEKSWLPDPRGDITLYRETTTTYSDEAGLIITKIDYWEISKAGTFKYSTDYNYILPGVSTTEFLANESLGERFDQDEIAEAFSILLKNGLIRQELIFRNESRFIIADKRLRKLIRAAKYLMDSELWYLCRKFELEEPTDEEKVRMSILTGKVSAVKTLRNLEMVRYDNNQIIKKKRYYYDYQQKRNIPWNEYYEKLKLGFAKSESEFKKELENLMKEHEATIKENLFLEDVLNLVSPVVLKSA